MAHRGRDQYIDSLLREYIFVDGPPYQRQFAPCPNVIDCARRIGAGGEDARGRRLEHTAIYAPHVLVISSDLSGCTRAQQRWQSDLARTLREPIQQRDRIVHCTGNFVIEMVEELRRKADSELRDRRLERGQVIRHRLIQAVNIEIVVTGDLLEYKRRVFDGPGNRSAMIERPRKRNNAAQADPPV